MVNLIGESARSAKTSGRAETYIHEIQGLRAVAALLVAIYHVWFKRVSGGVDAFFVIAAFFLVTSFLKRGPICGRDVLSYYANTARRVCPTAALVIVSTVAGSAILLPDMYVYDELRHAVASTLFIENWWLAITGTDYLNLETPASPFQQMWALSLQMQHYLALPLVLWGVAVAAKRTLTDLRSAFAWTFGLIFVGSFFYSLVATAMKQNWAYFDSLARSWEYMAGAFLALYINRIPILRPGIAKLIGYGALFVLMSFAAFLPVGRLFPGVAALIPVVATMIIVVIARSGTPIVLLGHPVLMKLGDISFAFYLWHWPLLIFFRHQTGGTEVGFAPGVAIIGLAGGLAWVSVKGFEEPFRRWAVLARRPAVSLAATALVLMLPVVSISGWKVSYGRSDAAAQVELAAFKANPLPRDGELQAFVPAAILARRDVPIAYADDCHQTIESDQVIECEYGQSDGSATVAIVGGSHALQWLPALRARADDLDLRIVTLTKSSCTLTVPTEEFFGDDPRSCRAWNVAVQKRLFELDPDLVFAIATRWSDQGDFVPKGYLSKWQTLTRNGIPVLALRDNPWFDEDVVACIERNRSDPMACALSRDDVLSRDDFSEELDLPGVKYVDLSDLYCDEATCWPVRDGILLYRDRHHITASFALAHADRVMEPLAQALTSKQVESVENVSDGL